MGQRLQVFIKIHNPLKNESIVEDLKGFDKENLQLKRAEIVFGKGKTSMLAFHHQWLYGLTAAAICANIMREVAKSDSPCHIFSKEIQQFPYYSDEKTGASNKVRGFMNLVQTLLFNQFDTEFAEMGARYGIERTLDLVDNCFDEKTGKFDKRWDCRKDFRSVDNNDGIIIIDAVEKKYCFMSIFGGGTLESLTVFTPVSAVDYVKCYYPVTKSELASDGSAAEIKSELAGNVRISAFVKEKFSNFAMLSLDEVKKMFPKVYRDLAKEKVPA